MGKLTGVVATRPVTGLKGSFTTGQIYEPSDKKERDRMLKKNSWRPEKEGDAEAWADRVKQDPALRALAAPAAKAEPDAKPAGKGKAGKAGKAPAAKQQPDATPGASDPAKAGENSGQSGEGEGAGNAGQSGEGETGAAGGSDNGGLNL